MKIYLCHSTGFNYEKELYEPLNNVVGHQFVFPHQSDSEEHSKDVIASCDLVLAEVSYPSTGIGIELGWANAAGIPIVCVYRADTKPSSALRHIAKSIAPYDDSEDLIMKVEEMVKNVF